MHKYIVPLKDLGLAGPHWLANSVRTHSTSVTPLSSLIWACCMNHDIVDLMTATICNAVLDKTGIQ